MEQILEQERELQPNYQEGEENTEDHTEWEYQESQEKYYHEEEQE